MVWLMPLSTALFSGLTIPSRNYQSQWKIFPPCVFHLFEYCAVAMGVRLRICDVCDTQGVSCRPHPCHKSTQTEGLSEPTPVPVAVPIHVPTPCKMYNAPFPVPVPIPLPFPVPIFIPTTRNSMKGIMKQIKKIMNKVSQRFCSVFWP
jgi:hypothetical protein